MRKNYPMTQEGKKQLEKELAYLKNEKQKEINQEIKKHHSFCDFSDNASFDQMLDEQALLKNRIKELENQLAYSEVILPKKDKETKIQLGDTVYFKELADGSEEHYTIVGQAEANPFKNKISSTSPIGKALLGHELGDELVIQIPDGEMIVRILAIK